MPRNKNCGSKKKKKLNRVGVTIKIKCDCYVLRLYSHATIFTYLDPLHGMWLRAQLRGQRSDLASLLRCMRSTAAIEMEQVEGTLVWRASLLWRGWPTRLKELMISSNEENQQLIMSLWSHGSIMAGTSIFSSIYSYAIKIVLPWSFDAIASTIIMIKLAALPLY